MQVMEEILMTMVSDAENGIDVLLLFYYSTL